MEEDKLNDKNIIIIKLIKLFFLNIYFLYNKFKFNMGFSLGNLFEFILLMVNAFAILNERFLKKYDLNRKPNFGDSDN